MVVGVRAGADLGRVRVKNGYAFFLPEKNDEVLLTLKARARQGKPIGAGILGRVRRSVSGRGGLGRDLDRDGLPGAFDVDDDGDLIYDNVDRSARRRACCAATAEEQYNARWVMNGGLQVSYLADRRGYTQGVSGYALNQNAAGPFAANARVREAARPTDGAARRDLHAVCRESQPNSTAAIGRPPTETPNSQALVLQPRVARGALSRASRSSRTSSTPTPTAGAR